MFRLSILAGALCALLAAGCATAPKPKPAPAATLPPAGPKPPPPEPFPVMPGIDVLESQGFAILQGKRVGLLTHDAAASRTGEPTWSVLDRAPGVKLVALFAAEHGIDGRAPASAVIADQVHAPTGKPVHSLYGNARRPPRELLKEIDVMVIDLQDIGSRSYTFISAMRETLEACFNAGVEVVVLDRPNPLGGVKVDGPGVDPEWRSYVGAFPIPYVHGLTVGELARLALGTPGVLQLDDKARAAARLVVVPMRGWRRTMRWPETGLRWRQTSPYIADFAAVEGYAITGLGCILGGWSHGVGREQPFRGIHYRGHTADALVRELNGLGVRGLAFRKIEFVNGERKKVQAVVVDIADWNALRPTELSFHLMRLSCAWSGGNPFKAATKAQRQSFNRHVGSAAWWAALVRDGAKVEVRPFVERWAAEAQTFREASRRFWLYPDANGAPAPAPPDPTASAPAAIAP